MKKVLVFLMGCVVLIFLAKPVLAVPTLQLDIAGGTYYDGTETIIAPGDEF
ncbi:MAG: hypothetical protein JRJ85_22250, partial [Deltaproteobacteria bacterium]|nr:hypothetical protein [Deltaproteobacteria bacterium]